MSVYDVSVVIPTYQHGHLLQRAVLSALQAGAAEVVIVDDCSTDNTETIGRNLAKGERVLYLRNPFHAGTIYARNRAIHSATYNLIVPLDSDDRLITLAPLIEAYQLGTWVTGGWREDNTDYKCPPAGMLRQKELGWVTSLFAKQDWYEVGGYNPVFSIGNEIFAYQRALILHGIIPVIVPDIIFERNTDAPNTARARAWNHIIKPLIDDIYPYPEVPISAIIR